MRQIRLGSARGNSPYHFPALAQVKGEDDWMTKHFFCEPPQQCWNAKGFSVRAGAEQGA